MSEFVFGWGAKRRVCVWL